MLPTNLTSNEVKDSGGTEVEFLRSSVSGREVIFTKSGDFSGLHQLIVSHAESGSGLRLRRRSRIGFQIQHVSTVDNLTPLISRCYIVHDIPIGGLVANTVPTSLLANLGSFVFLDGTGTTHLFAGTGSGAQCLLNGTN
jgi:hypothetical protein